MAIVYVVIGLLVVLVLAYILINNSLISARNKCDEAWSGIDVQLKRRHDLVPNLVETVKGYAAHERETLTRVTDARAGAVAADDAPPPQRAQAESALSAALGGIRAVAEQYPQLRAADNFIRLQAQLAEIEDEIQAARRIYNSNVQIYNTRQQIFPNSIVAARGDFRAREFFEIEVASERDVPQVSFS
ncbi:MAG TPA: LemA family protein [Thermoleophilaceae bacterium]|nr:LemA family protein [Thermoleophilaceae bacterium]